MKVCTGSVGDRRLGLAVDLYYIEKPDSSSDPAFNYTLTTSHRWSMTGVNCDDCGNTWSNTGIEYPLIDLGDIDPAGFVARGPTSLATFADLRDKIAKLIPEGYPILPGTELGPSQGAASGRFSDILRGNWPAFSPPVCVPSPYGNGHSVARLHAGGNRI